MGGEITNNLKAIMLILLISTIFLSISSVSAQDVGENVTDDSIQLAIHDTDNDNLGVSSKLDTNIHAQDINSKPLIRTDIESQINDENGDIVKNGTAVLILEGVNYTTEVNNGVFIFKGILMPEYGNYTAVINYLGNDYYNPSNAIISIDIGKVEVIMSSQNVSGYVGDNGEVIVKLTDSWGNQVLNGICTMIIDGKTYDAEVSDGVAVIDFVFPDADADIVIYYLGNDYYHSNKTSIKIQVMDESVSDDNAFKSKNIIKTSDNVTGNPILAMIVVLIVLSSNILFKRRK